MSVDFGTGECLSDIYIYYSVEVLYLKVTLYHSIWKIISSVAIGQNIYMTLLYGWWSIYVSVN